MATTYFVTPSGVTVRVSIRDRTGVSGMTPKAGEIIRAAAEAAATVGLSRIDITAGKGGGHKSHGAGTEWDIKGYAPDGSLWTPQQRVAVAEGGRTAGADRFGLYSYGKGSLGSGSLHIGYSGKGRPSAVWGANGLTSGDGSRNFSNPAEKAFLASFQSGKPFALDEFREARIDPSTGVPNPRPRPEQAPVQVANQGTLNVSDMNASTGTLVSKLDRGQPYTGQPQPVAMAPDQWRDFQTNLRTGQVAWQDLPPAWQQELSSRLPNAREAYEKVRNAPREEWVEAEARQDAARPFRFEPTRPDFDPQFPETATALATTPPTTRSVQAATSMANQDEMPPAPTPGVGKQMAMAQAGGNELRPILQRQATIPSSAHLPMDPEFQVAGGARPEGPALSQRAMPPTPPPRPEQVANVPTPPSRPSLYPPEVAAKIGTQPFQPGVNRQAPAPPPRPQVSAVPPALAARRAAPALGGLIKTIFQALIPGARGMNGRQQGRDGYYGPGQSLFAGNTGAYGSTVSMPGSVWHSANFDPVSGGSKYAYFTNPSTGTGGYYDNQGDLHTYSI